MITVYGIVASRASRPLWALEELGVPFEHVPVDYKNKGAKTPELLAINPNGHVPVLTDGELVLFESMAINLYLAEKYGAGTLWPADVADHGRCYQWSFWVMTEVERWALTVLHQRVTVPEAERDAEALAQAEGALRGPLGVLEAALEGRDYLLGADFSIADLNVSVVLNWARIARMDLAPWPRVAEWMTRCVKRPAMRRMLARREAEKKAG